MIYLKDVNFAYNNGPIVLQDINLEIKVGEFIGVVGPNGSGKTTLLKLIAGLLKPNNGRIAMATTALGYVAQFTTFNNDFPISVADTVLMGRLRNTRVLGNYTKADRQQACKILEKLEIADLRNKPLNSLSGGQLQRVMIARALVCKPKVLLLDEPTANIDIHAEKNIFELLQQLNEEGITILVVSHDVGFISQYIKRVICVNKQLRCHITSKLTPALIQELYGMKVKVVRHDS